MSCSNDSDWFHWNWSNLGPMRCLKRSTNQARVKQSLKGEPWRISGFCCSWMIGQDSGGDAGSCRSRLTTGCKSICSVLIVSRKPSNDRTTPVSSSHLDTDTRKNLKRAMLSVLRWSRNYRSSRLDVACNDLRMHWTVTAYRMVHGRSSSLNKGNARHSSSHEIILGNFLRTTWSVMSSLIKFSSSSRLLQKNKQIRVRDPHRHSTNLARFIHVRRESTPSRNKRRKHLLS